MSQCLQDTNMNLTVKTELGSTIRLGAAQLVALTDVPGSTSGGLEMCAVVDIGDALDGVPQGQGASLPTRLGLMLSDGGAFAVLNVVLDGTLVFTVLDLGDRRARRMLLGAPPEGIAFVCIGNGVRRLIRVPVAHVQKQVSECCPNAVSASFETVANLLGEVVQMFNDLEGLRQLGLADIAFERVLLAAVGARRSAAPFGHEAAFGTVSGPMH